MGRRYRTKGNGLFMKRDGSWLNFWLLTSTIFILLFFTFARSGIDNPITSFISVIGLFCLPVAPFLFILSIIGNSWDKSVVDCTISKLEHSSSLVRSMAVWALFKLSIDRFKEEKKLRYSKERDIAVKEEWNEGAIK